MNIYRLKAKIITFFAVCCSQTVVFAQNAKKNIH